MASMTLANARLLVQEHLDEDSTLSDPRWTTTQIDTALASALSTCLADYISAGGDRFTETISVSTTSGSVDLSSYNPSRIDGVAYISGQTRFPLRAAKRLGLFQDDTSDRSLEIALTRHLDLPTTTSHPLIGIGATEVNSVPMFANWVCLRAARQLKIKDDERSAAVEALEATVQDAVIKHARVPQSFTFPCTRRNALNDLAWVYDHRTQTLTLGYL